MSEERKIIYCPDCGKENAADAVLCRECGEAINQEEHLFRDFLVDHIKDDLKGKVTDRLYDIVKNWLLSHLYGTVATVMVIAAVTSGAVSAASRASRLEERPAAIAELSLLSSEEQALFEANRDHEIFNPEEFEEVWRPAVLSHSLLTEKNSCYGWVIVRDMELSAKELFAGYSELYIAPGVTLTVNGTVKEKKSFTDFYVAPGAALIINGDVKGGANIANDGTTVINGNYDAGSGLLTCNRGSFTVNGALTGALDFYTFRGAKLVGTDQTNAGIHYYDIDAWELYQGVTGMSGMFVVVGSLP